MKKISLLLIISVLFYLTTLSQIVLLNEDFGAEESFASPSLATPAAYDLDPVASYIPTDSVVINYYGLDKTSEGKYEGASGGNFFLLSNNWQESDIIHTWANMNVTAYSELDILQFGCAFSGGPNDAWLGSWMFSLEYSFDDVINDPENANWYGVDLIANAAGWPDPQTAGGENWSLVNVDAGINMIGEDLLSVRIKSNGTFDYHFDDFKIIVKTPTSGMERVSIAKETFGPKTFYRGPANAYSGYTNGGKFSFNDYQVHYQNYNNTFTSTYEGNTNDDNWWITDDDADGVAEDTLVFSVNTSDYADVQLQFGFTYWGGVPGNMVGIYYTTDSVTWYPVTTVSPLNSYPGTNEERLTDGYFHLIKYDDILPRSENLTLMIYQATPGQFIMDDLELTGVYQPLSSDATLMEISFPGLSGLVLDPEFNSEVTSYSVVLPNESKDAPVIEVKTTDAEAEYMIEDALDVTSDDEADRQSYIYVTSSDGETQLIYTLTFNVAKSSDASLSDLRVNGYSLDDFDPTTLSYNVVLTSETAAVPVVTALASVGNATVTINDAGSLPGTTSVVVTAEDAETTQTYTLNFSVAPTGLNERKEKADIYPVPAGDILNIRASGEIISIRITDITGKIVLEMKNSRSNFVSINMQALNMGVYILEVKEPDNQVQVLRFIKK
jgi:hypothetical protein